MLGSFNIFTNIGPYFLGKIAQLLHQLKAGEEITLDVTQNELISLHLFLKEWLLHSYASSQTELSLTY